MLNLFKEWLQTFRMNPAKIRRSRRRGKVSIRSAQIELLEPRTLLSASPTLLQDINGASFGSNLTNATVVGSTTFFVANDAIHGTELWKTDGTNGGTVFVADINPGSAGSSARNLTNVNGTLFFVANDGTNGEELWKSDGTAAGTALVQNIMPGSASSQISALTNVNGTLFFTAEDGLHGQELWKSNGTAAGTQLVTEINAGDGNTPAAQSSITGLTNINGTLFFGANDGVHGVELWKSNGTAAGTQLVQDIWSGENAGTPFSSSPTNLTNVNGTLFFTANDGVHGNEVWKSDGTPGGTVLVDDISPASGSYASGLTNINGTLYFFATDESYGMQLWKSDGTTPGTARISQIPSSLGLGFGLYGAESLTNVNGTLFFAANDGSSGQELWKSDGTSAGTVQLLDIFPGDYYIPDSGYLPRPHSSYPFALTNVNGTLFFSANDGVHGAELWKSDGTTAGTVLFQDLLPGVGASALPNNLTYVNGSLLFSATDATHGNELWKTDGTVAGTSLVKDINTQTVGSSPSQPTNVNGTLFFTAFDVEHGTELWKTDGSTGGTVLVKDIAAGNIGSAPSFLTNVNGTLFFTAYDVNNRRQLWKSDGTSAGTVKISNFDYSNSSTLAYPGFLTDVNGTLFFTASNPATGVELWKSDGTTAGTVEVSDIRPGTALYPLPSEQGGGYTSLPAGSFPRNLTNINGTLYFAANDGTSGNELWKSDGTSAGTVLVKDINTSLSYDNYGNTIGTNGSYVSNITNVNGTLFFVANDGVSGQELWKSNGTSGGTVLVRDINSGSSSSTPQSLTNVNGTLFFASDDGINGVELWKSDGSNGGTALVKNIYTGSIITNGNVVINSSRPTQLTNVNGTLYFSANDGLSGNELWKSDGTSIGTALVSDLLPGANGSSPRQLTNVNGTLFFDANNGISGDEIWESNGTNAGTQLSFDLLPGSGGSSPTGLINVNGTLFFAADDGQHGSELWSNGVKAGSTTATLESTASSSTYGQVVTLTAVVATTTPGAGTLSGTVTFLDGTQILGTASIALVGGRYVATFNLPANLAVGAHQLKAIYGGNAVYGASTTPARTLAVQKASTSISLTSSGSPSVFGQSVTLKAKIGVVAPGAGVPAGNVVFKEGTTTVGIGTLSVVNGEVIATLTLTSLSVGGHSLTASYVGNTSFNAVTSTVLTQTVAPATTTSTLVSSTPTSSYGQPVTIKSIISVIAPGSGIPTGTVTFYDGATVLGTAVVGTVNGQYVSQFTLPANLAVGTHSLKAIYSGNPKIASSTSAVITQIVNKAATTISVKSSTNSSVFGQPVTLTAQVGLAGAGAGIPTGTVTFKDGTTTLGTGTLSVVDGKVIATLTTTALPKGARSITAVYAGDTHFSGQTSAAITVSIKATTQIALVSSDSTSTYGQSVTVKVTLSVVAPGTGAPTGTLTLFDGTRALEVRTISATGSSIEATFTLRANLSVGSHALKAVYSGDTNFSASTSPVFTQTVSKVNTTASLTSSTSFSVYGQSITLTAKIGYASALAAAPTGTVTFKDGNVVLGTGTLSVVNGQLIATLNIPALPAGVHSLTAVYQGDATFNGTTSAATTVTVIRAISSAVIGSTSWTSTYGQTVTIKAFISILAPGAAAPTGTVSFFDGTTYLGTSNVVLSGGKYAAALQLPTTLSVGMHSLTAIYFGDNNVTPSIAPQFNQIVVRANTTLNLTSSMASSPAGQPITFTATLAVVAPGSGVPTGTVTFKDGTSTLGTGTLSVVNGKVVAKITTTTLAVGTHSISAIFTGNASFNPFTSAAINVKVV